jgi:tripartite-type tricarboxylate transporter receptor subunit TctC
MEIAMTAESHARISSWQGRYYECKGRKIMRRRSFLLGGIAAGIGLTHSDAHAAIVDGWPDHEIRVILPVSVGGANDLLARAVFEHVGRTLGTTFVVMNYPGGGAVRGTVLLAQSKNDGYSVGNVSYSGLLLTPHITEVSYKLSDFDMLGSAGEPLYGLGVKADSSIQSVADVIALAKKRPVTIVSNTIVNMVCMFQLAAMTGSNLKWIPTNSETQAVMLVGGGDADCVMQSAPELNAGVDGGRIKLIASANNVRWPNRPTVSTIIEQGYNVANSVPLGYGAPAGLNPAIRLKLQKAILGAAKAPEMIEKMQRIGVLPRPMDGEALSQAFKTAAPIMDKVLADAGMKKF